MNIIFGNYGNPTIAAIQWAIEQNIRNLSVVSVQVGWEAIGWHSRLEKATAFARKAGFKTIQLQSKLTFHDLVLDRHSFPSTKFQWCAGYLKGLPFLDWLDENDPNCEAIIIFGKRRQDSPVNFDLPEYINKSEHFGDRKIWYPLYLHSEEEFKQLLLNSEIDILKTRSLECDPCVNSYGKDLARLQDNDIIKTGELEKQVGSFLFELPIQEMVKQARQNVKKDRYIFDMGCGSVFGCGE